MKKFAKISRPIVLAGAIATLAVSVAFIVITLINPKINYDQLIVFCLSFGITTRSLTVLNFAMSVLTAVSAFMSGELRVLSTVAAIFSLPGFIFGFQLAPMCSKERIRETFNFFGGGADIITPMVFIALTSLVLLILSAVGIKRSKAANNTVNE